MKRWRKYASSWAQLLYGAYLRFDRDHIGDSVSRTPSYELFRRRSLELRYCLKPGRLGSLSAWGRGVPYCSDSNFEKAASCTVEISTVDKTTAELHAELIAKDDIAKLQARVNLETDDGKISLLMFLLVHEFKPLGINSNSY
jgi:hypothetical protein